MFGTPGLPGGQAQYVRVPKAGGTLFKVDDILSASPDIPPEDSSFLLLADILPTGVFAAIQPLQHPKLAAILSGVAYPHNGYLPAGLEKTPSLAAEDKVLTIAIVGLGPVGMVSINIFITLHQMIEAHLR